MSELIQIRYLFLHFNIGLYSRFLRCLRRKYQLCSDQSASCQQFKVIRVDAEPVPAALFDQLAIRDVTDKCMVACSLRADHFCTAVILYFHDSAIPAVRDLSLPYPATGIILLVSHIVKFFLFDCHRLNTFGDCLTCSRARSYFSA